MCPKNGHFWVRVFKGFLAKKCKETKSGTLNRLYLKYNFTQKYINLAARAVEM